MCYLVSRNVTDELFFSVEDEGYTTCVHPFHCISNEGEKQLLTLHCHTWQQSHMTRGAAMPQGQSGVGCHRAGLTERRSATRPGEYNTLVPQGRGTEHCGATEPGESNASVPQGRSDGALKSTGPVRVTLECHRVGMTKRLDATGPGGV